MLNDTYFLSKQQKISNYDQHKQIKTIIGIICSLCACISIGVVQTFQQKLFRQYHLEPLVVAGTQGCIGFGFMIIILVIMSNVSCPFGLGHCVFENKEPYFQRFYQFFYQNFHNSIVIITTIVCFFSLSLFYLTGIAITKYMSSLTRSVCDATRPTFVYSISLTVTLLLGHKNFLYRWQAVELVSILIKIFGCIVLLIGNLTYNGIIKWVFFQEEYLEKQKQKDNQKSIQV